MTPAPFIDHHSVSGKDVHVDESCQVLVVGAGPAGLSAAIEAASLGLGVILVDENPVPFTTMGEDVPLHYGNAMSGLARNRNAMMEAFVASEPGIERAFDAGVDVRLATSVWGLYGNGESVAWLPGLVAGLSDGERTWLVGCERVIVATGRRDMGLAFPGWLKPGVLGATAAQQLATRYGAIEATAVVLLGTSAEALSAGLSLRAAGLRIAAVVEQAREPVGPSHLVEDLRAGGTEILTGHVVREALGLDRVEAVAVAALGADGHVAEGAQERVIACDAVVLGVGATPVVDLLDSVGCKVAFQPERGGWAPVVGAGQATSNPHLLVAGDAAGLWAEKTLDRTMAEREGRCAARAVAASLTGSAPVPDDRRGPSSPTFDVGAYRLAWVLASVVEARAEPYVCQCEEVTAREILEVRPPRYLGAPPDRRNDRSLRGLLHDGPPHPDQVKRLTRAGMGPCQGRRCREQVSCLLALGSQSALAEIPLAGYRAPVRPLSLSLTADRHEARAMTQHWDAWFGIAPQYRLAHELPSSYTVAHGNPGGPVASD